MDKKQWVIDLAEKLRQLPSIKEAQSEEWKRRSIYKLPPCITDRNDKAYKPQLVSFGPYHHADSNLKLTDCHKERALLYFLNRSGKPLECYVEALGDIVQDLEGAYDSLEPKWKQNPDEFLELMLRDGCFMLEILQTITGTVDYYSDTDPIFRYHGMLFWVPHILSDMLMLENQLPMLLLEKLLAVAYPEKDRRDINKLVQKFYFFRLPEKELGKCMHVLDVYRKRLLCKGPSHDQVQGQGTGYTKIKNTPKSCLPANFRNTIKKYQPKIIIHKLKTWLSCTTQEEAAQEEEEQEKTRDIFSARELREAGVRIRRSSTSSLKDIHFDSNRGILSLPRILVDDTTATLFLNLIAFEGHHFEAGNEVTDYIYFMDGIIDNAKDVEVLKSHDIIYSFLGSNEAVADLFNSISKDITTDDSGNLGEVRRMANQYCKTRWHRWRASFIETYFRNPWAIISVVAAFFLFTLAIIQTVYTAGQYYQK